MHFRGRLPSRGTDGSEGVSPPNRGGPRGRGGREGKERCGDELAKRRAAGPARGCLHGAVRGLGANGGRRQGRHPGGLPGMGQGGGVWRRRHLPVLHHGRRGRHGPRPARGRREAGDSPWIRDFFARYTFKFSDWNSKEVVVAGDVAFHRYTGVATLTPRAGGASLRQDRKYLDVFRRGADGRWRASHHVFNLNR